MKQFNTFLNISALLLNLILFLFTTTAFIVYFIPAVFQKVLFQKAGKKYRAPEVMKDDIFFCAHHKKYLVLRLVITFLAVQSHNLLCPVCLDGQQKCVL